MVTPEGCVLASYDMITMTQSARVDGKRVTWPAMLFWRDQLMWPRRSDVVEYGIRTGQL